jgi:hypothetical protein
MDYRLAVFTIVMFIIVILVGGIPTPLKIIVSWDDSSQLNGKIKAMFQTTNHYI